MDAGSVPHPLTATETAATLISPLHHHTSIRPHTSIVIAATTTKDNTVVVTRTAVSVPHLFTIIITLVRVDPNWGYLISPN